MEYLYAVLVLIGIVFLTTILTGVLKILVPIAYIAFGYYLGTESLIIGIGSSFGAIIIIVILKIKEQYPPLLFLAKYPHTV